MNSSSVYLFGACYGVSAWGGRGRASRKAGGPAHPRPRPGAPFGRPRPSAVPARALGRLTRTRPALGLPIRPRPRAGPQRDRTAPQDPARPAACGQSCALAGGAEPRARGRAEAHPGAARDTSEGLLTELPEKRPPAVLLALRTWCPAPALWVAETRRPHSGRTVLRPASAKVPRDGTPFEASAGLSVLPLPRSPEAEGPASLGRRLPGARPLSARRCGWPAVLACARCKPAAETGRGFVSPGTRTGRGAPAEPRPCTCCPTGLFTLAHTTLLVAGTTPAPGTGFAGAPKMSPPVPQVWLVAPQRLL